MAHHRHTGSQQCEKVALATAVGRHALPGHRLKLRRLTWGALIPCGPHLGVPLGGVHGVYACGGNAQQEDAAHKGLRLERIESVQPLLRRAGRVRPELLAHRDMMESLKTRFLS